MHNLLRTLDLMMAATLFFFMIGCVGGEEALPANFVSSNPPDGGEIAVNRILTIIFDNPPQDVTVNGQPATVTGKTATWRATGLTPGQPATIQIAWKDGSKTITLNVKAEEEIPEFVDENKGVLHLREGSPCINAGSNGTNIGALK